MSNVFPYPGENPSGGGGPRGPDLGVRLERLEKIVEPMDRKVSSSEVTLARIEGILSQFPKASDWAALRSDVGDLKGRAVALPTIWQMFMMIVSIGAAAAALIFAVLRLGK